MDAVELRSLAGTTDLPTHFAAQYGSPEALSEHLAARRRTPRTGSGGIHRSSPWGLRSD